MLPSAFHDADCTRSRRSLLTLDRLLSLGVDSLDSPIKHLLRHTPDDSLSLYLLLRRLCAPLDRHDKAGEDEKPVQIHPRVGAEFVVDFRFIDEG